MVGCRGPADQGRRPSRWADETKLAADERTSGFLRLGPMVDAMARRIAETYLDFDHSWVRFAVQYDFD